MAFDDDDDDDDDEFEYSKEKNDPMHFIFNYLTANTGQGNKSMRSWAVYAERTNEKPSAFHIKFAYQSFACAAAKSEIENLVRQLKVTRA